MIGLAGHSTQLHVWPGWCLGHWCGEHGSVLYLTVWMAFLCSESNLLRNKTEDNDYAQQKRFSFSNKIF